MTEQVKKLIDSITVFTQHDVSCSGGLTKWVSKSDFDRIVGELTKWNKVEDCLPEINQLPINGCWENEDLIVVKTKQYDSLEFAVFTELNGHKYFTIPAMGECEIDEISEWRYIY